MDKLKLLSNKETLKAYVKLFGELLCVFNAILTAKGITPLPFNEYLVVEVAYYVIGISAVIYACWKNHNFTPAAQAAQKVLKSYKEDGCLDDAIEEIIEEAGDING